MTSNYPHLREAQRLVWNEHCTLSAHARTIAAYLLNRMNASYEGAFPSVDRIAVDTGFERKTVIKYTKEIVDSRLLERTAGRKGMYCYRVKDMDKIGEMLDAKLAEYVQRFWQDLGHPEQLTGTPEGPVPPTDRSTACTATGPSQGLQPVPPTYPERLTVKAQVKAQYKTPRKPSRSLSKTSEHSLQDNAESLDSGAGSELQVQELGVAEFGEGIPWVESGLMPRGYAQPLWFDATLGKLSLVNDAKGRAYYQALRDEFPIWAIQQGLTAASGKASGAKARAGGLQGLLRQYVGYAMEKQNGRPGATSAFSGPFRGGAFQP